MLCDKYKESLIEAAASGAALPVAVREHVDTCGHCGAMLAVQQALFISIDAGLLCRANTGVPSNFEHRVRAALPIQVSQGRRPYSLVLAFGSMAATAALALTISLTYKPNNGRKESPLGAVAETEQLASPRATSGDSKELEMLSQRPQHSHARASNIARHPNVSAPGSGGVEVLVPPGQQELLVKYMEGVAALRARVTYTASLQHVADMKPMEVPSTEISELVVRPLSDLSSN